MVRSLPSLVETTVYDWVKDYPAVKDGLKWCYQRVFSLAGRKSEWGTENLVIRQNAFFGFHDKDPWSADGRTLLGHRFVGKGIEPVVSDRPVELVGFSGLDWKVPKPLGTTRAWNWQQGAQLQWCGVRGTVVFNDFVDGRCRGKEVDLGGVVEQIHPYPIAACSPQGDFLASICFKTFGDAMPGYGYDFMGAEATSPVEPDRLLVFDRSGMVVEEVIGDRLVSKESRASGDEIGFISHVTFDKKGEQIAFMRRLSKPGRRLRSKLFILDLNKGCVSEAPFDGMVSHYCWMKEDEILAFASYAGRDGFFKFRVSDGYVEDCTGIMGARDGHPHSDNEGRYVVFDSYPDRARVQRLALVKEGVKMPLDIGFFYSPMDFWGERRVDLHPRIRADGKYVCIDCSTTGVRSLATLRLPTRDETV